MPSLNEISDYYTEKVQGGNYSRFTTETEKQKQNIFRSYLKIFHKVTGCSIKNQEVLDVGCFNGFSLSAIKECGGIPFGVELQREAALEAAARFPGQVLQGDASDFVKFGRQFDVITMSDVIEHLVDPFDVISKLRRGLKKGGYLILTTPNTRSVMCRLLGKVWPSYTPIHHINIFNDRNLAEMLQKRGFEVVSIQPLWKKLSLGYVKSILPHLSPVLGRFSRLIPRVFDRVSCPLNGGEMYIIARAV
jgi:2-polyprenyl-3-methyl-5-hydroxy-6-metoxy-1,4-benzoquinol methylase